MYEPLQRILEESSRIVFFGGAGVSTESGIPDFRSENGLYQATHVYGRSPEEIVSHSFFCGHMDDFFAYYKNNMIFPNAKPNKAHLALAELERMGKLTAIITQNIDGLHQMAGNQSVFELHGSVLRNYCMDCKTGYGLDYILDPAHCTAPGREEKNIPFCEKCGGVVRPDVVLYQESLDDSVIEGAVSAIEKADTLIVGGTSLVVYPAAGLLQYFQGKHLVLINRAVTPYDGKADLVLHEAIGEVLGACVL